LALIGFVFSCPEGLYFVIISFQIRLCDNFTFSKLALFFQLYPCEMAALPISRGEPRIPTNKHFYLESLFPDILITSFLIL
jgi:hypothetical protein